MKAIGKEKRKNRNGCYQCGSTLHRAKDCPDNQFHNGKGDDVGNASVAYPHHVKDSPIPLGSFHSLPNKFRYIELFAGIGGFRLALDRLGGQCVFASEMDRFAKKNYELNHSDCPAGDITKISEEDIPEHDLLVGGFPCQAFSSSGNRLGFDDERGILFLEIVRILKRRQPKAILLENVRGLVTHDEGKTLTVILNELEQVGYTMRYKVLDAIDLVPQERKRVYLVGIRRDLDSGDYKYPELSTIRRRGFVDVLERDLTDDELQKLSLSPHQLGKVRTQAYTQKFPEARFLSDITGPTKTLQSSYASYMVGSQFVPSPPDITDGWRKLSPREAARLQGFPEDFHLCPFRSYRQMGNAVVPSMIVLVAAPLIPILYQPSEDAENWEELGWKVAKEILLEACPKDERQDTLRDILGMKQI